MFSEIFNNILLQNVFSTLIGGILLTVLLFILKEKVFSPVPITGLWTFEVKVINSTRINFRGMTLIYLAMVRREGQSVLGRGEKVGEKLGAGKYVEYPMKTRKPFEIRGSIIKSYLTNNDEITLDLMEEGPLRNSITQQKLVYDSKNQVLIGRFISSAANSSGIVKWTKGYSGINEKNY